MQEENEMGIFKNLFKQAADGPYRRNPKGEALSPDQQQAICVGAILAESNCEFVDSLQPTVPREIKQKKRLLEDWWGITSPQEATETLNWLKNSGHRGIFNAVLAYATHALMLEPTFEDFARAFEEAGLPTIDEDIAKEYPREVELTKRHIDMFHAIYYTESDAEADRLIERLVTLLGDEETYGDCAHLIYDSMTDKYEMYVEFAYNLRQTFEKLQKRGFVGEAAELKNINPAAWDMGRMVCVARWCYACGYITEDMAWKYIFFAQKESARLYENWEDFGKAYVTGRAIWGGEDGILDEMIDITEGLLKDERSPWRFMPLK